MELFSEDFMLGNFRASDYGLIVGSFSYNGESEDDIYIAPTVIEEFIGHNPIPIYLGQKYENKLSLTLTVIKNPSIYFNDTYFSERELRGILRVITGIRGYQWLKIINEEIDNDLWYRARVSNVTYKRVGGRVVGIILEMVCDSAFAWSNNNEVTIRAKANQKFYIFNNTDDLNNYVLPLIEIVPSSAGDVVLTNATDNNWETTINNVKANEKITIDARKEIISSNTTHDLLLNDFNLHWIRLVPDKNEYTCNVDATITFKYRVPRKVGFTE